MFWNQGSIAIEKQNITIIFFLIDKCLKKSVLNMIFRVNPCGLLRGVDFSMI